MTSEMRRSFCFLILEKSAVSENAVVIPSVDRDFFRDVLNSVLNFGKKRVPSISENDFIQEFHVA